MGDQRDPEEEREDGGQSLTLLLQPESIALNGANFTCRVTTKNGRKFEETVTVEVKSEYAYMRERSERRHSLFMCYIRDKVLISYVRFLQFHSFGKNISCHLRKY